MKRSKLPRTPLALYINLYCKKNNNDNVEKADMIEATKSWLSLTEEERMVFVEKLNKLREEYKEHFAKCLENVEPYMKKKTRRDSSKQIESNAVVEPGGDTSKIQENVDCNKGIEQVNRDCAHDLEPQDQPHKDTDDHASDHLHSSQNIDDCDDQMELEVPEPVPPAVKTAEDLFNMVETGTGCDRSWKTLSKAEKAFYHKSVLALKKNYIEKYKAYLESLPSEELHQYYMRKVSYDL